MYDSLLRSHSNVTYTVTINQERENVKGPQLNPYVFHSTYFHLWSADITAGIHYISDRGTPGPTALFKLTSNFYLVLCGPEKGSRSSMIVFARISGWPPVSFVPRTRSCGQNEVSDQLTFWTSRSVTKPAEPPLNGLCKTKTVLYFHRLDVISVPHAYNATDAAIVKDRQHPFVGPNHHNLIILVQLNK